MKYYPLLISLLLMTASAADITYTFGVNLATNSTNSQTARVQIESLRGYEVWRDWWNGLPRSVRTTKWGDTFEVALRVETFSEYGYEPWMRQALFDVYSNMSESGEVDYFFGPTGWEGVSLRKYAEEELDIPIMVCPTDSSEQYYKIPGSFGTATANVLTMASWLPYLRIERVKNVSILQVNDGVYQSQMCDGFAAQAALSGISVLDHFTDMPFDWWTLGSIDDSRAAVWSSALGKVKASNPDAVIVCDYNHGAEFSLKYMREADWTPKFIGISPLGTGKVFEDSSLLDYVVIPTQYSPHAQYARQVNFTTSSEYNDLSLLRYGVPASSIMAESTLAGMLFSYVIVKSQSNTSQALLDAMSRIQLESFMGTSQFDIDGRQTMLPLMMQLTSSGEKPLVVGPPLAAIDDLIYPMPTWKERKPSPRSLSRVEVAALVLMAIGLISNFTWAILLVTHWNNKRIRASSPVFCLSLLLGGTIAYVSIPTWMPSLVTNLSCSFRAIVLPLGFIALFGSLIAKSDRIYRVFNMNTLEIIRISNLQVGCVILIIVLVQVVLSTLVTTVTRLSSSLRVVDVHRPSLSYYTCTSSAALKALFGVNVAYIVALLAWGSYLAYHIRLIPYSLYDESKTIIFSIYNAAVFCAIAIVIQLSVGNNNRDLTFMVTAVCIFLGVMITTCTLFLPKFKSIYAPSERSSSRGSSYNSNSTQLEKIKKENTRLKAELDKLSKDKE